MKQAKVTMTLRSAGSSQEQQQIVTVPATVQLAVQIDNRMQFVIVQITENGAKITRADVESE